MIDPGWIWALPGLFVFAMLCRFLSMNAADDHTGFWAVYLRFLMRHSVELRHWDRSWNDWLRANVNANKYHVEEQTRGLVKYRVKFLRKYDAELFTHKFECQITP